MVNTKNNNQIDDFFESIDSVTDDTEEEIVDEWNKKTIDKKLAKEVDKQDTSKILKWNEENKTVKKTIKSSWTTHIPTTRVKKNNVEAKVQNLNKKENIQKTIVKENNTTVNNFNTINNVENKEKENLKKKNWQWTFNEKVIEKTTTKETNFITNHENTQTNWNENIEKPQVKEKEIIQNNQQPTNITNNNTTVIQWKDSSQSWWVVQNITNTQLWDTIHEEVKERNQDHENKINTDWMYKKEYVDQSQVIDYTETKNAIQQNKNIEEHIKTNWNTINTTDISWETTTNNQVQQWDQTPSPILQQSTNISDINIEAKPTENAWTQEKANEIWNTISNEKNETNIFTNNTDNSQQNNQWLPITDWMMSLDDTSAIANEENKPKDTHWSIWWDTSKDVDVEKELTWSWKQNKKLQRFKELQKKLAKESMWYQIVTELITWTKKAKELTEEEMLQLKKDLSWLDGSTFNLTKELIENQEMYRHDTSFERTVNPINSIHESTEFKQYEWINNILMHVNLTSARSVVWFVWIWIVCLVLIYIIFWFIENEWWKTTSFFWIITFLIFGLILLYIFWKLCNFQDLKKTDNHQN